jgi:hypothetical protein
VHRVDVATFASRKAAAIFVLSFTCLGGLLASIDAGLRATWESESFLDCRDVKWIGYGYAGCNEVHMAVPGSVSGLWTEWVRDREEVVRSVFCLVNGMESDSRCRVSIPDLGMTMDSQEGSPIESCTSIHQSPTEINKPMLLHCLKSRSFL